MRRSPTTRELIVQAAQTGVPDGIVTQLVDLHIAEQARRVDPVYDLGRRTGLLAVWNGLVDAIWGIRDGLIAVIRLVCRLGRREA